MRLLVCGSRDWTDERAIWQELFVLPRDTVVIHGGAKGADSIADTIARKLGMKVEVYLPEWRRWGNSAGIMRNLRMLYEAKPDRVYAFATGPTPGTSHMVSVARRAGVPTTVLGATL